MTPHQQEIIDTIESWGPMSAREIAAHLSSNYNNTSQNLRLLEHQKKIFRSSKRGNEVIWDTVS